MAVTGMVRMGERTRADDGVWSDAAGCFDRWVDGDQRALDDLVTVMTPVLWHIVRAYRLTEETAEDVIQTTWLALVRRRHTITDSQAVGGWLIISARREAWRVAKVGQRDLSVTDQDLEAKLPQQRSAEREVVEIDERDRLWSAVSGLDERCQRLLRVVAFDQRPDYHRLSEELGMPVGSIGPTRGRCLTKLRAALSSSTSEGDVR